MDEFEQFFKKVEPFKLIMSNPLDKGKRKGLLITCKINDHKHSFWICDDRIEFADKTFTIDDFHELHTWVRDTFPSLMK
jgi:hypothetical protein